MNGVILMSLLVTLKRNHVDLEQASDDWDAFENNCLYLIKVPNEFISVSSHGTFNVSVITSTFKISADILYYNSNTYLLQLFQTFFHLNWCLFNVIVNPIQYGSLRQQNIFSCLKIIAASFSLSSKNLPRMNKKHTKTIPYTFPKLIKTKSGNRGLTPSKFFPANKYKLKVNNINTKKALKYVPS